MSSKLGDFQEMVSEIEDDEMLDAAETLLREMVEIQNMQEKIQALEDGLTEGKKAAFWFFAIGLDREQIDLAANTVIGRRRFLKDQLERAKLKEEANKPETNDSEQVIEKNDEIDDHFSCIVCGENDCVCSLV